MKWENSKDVLNTSEKKQSKENYSVTADSTIIMKISA